MQHRLAAQTQVQRAAAVLHRQLTGCGAPAGAHSNTSKGQKGEEDWPCSMALAGPDTLYVGTHRGRLQRVQMPGPGSPGAQQEEWRQLWQSPRAQPLSCLAVRYL